MTRVDRFPWLRQDRPQGEHPEGHKSLAAYPLRVLRREGAPLVISLVLHVAALLLLAPWLLMRTIPVQQIAVEVMLEPDASQPPPRRSEIASLLRGPERLPRMQLKSLFPPTTPRPVQAQSTQIDQQIEQQIEQPMASMVPAEQPGQGQSGRSSPAPRETAALSAPSAAGPAAAPDSAGSTALSRGAAEASAAAPREPSQGSAAQPSARAVASPSRPGEDRQEGLATLDGPASQVQAAQPEFRQAARQGGQASMRGGSQAPDEGLARQPGSPDQTALVAARAVPQSQSGSSASRGGTVSQVALPVARLSGQGGVVAAETTASAGLVQSAAPAPRADGAVASRTPASSGQGKTASGTVASSRSVNPAERGSGLVAAATPGTGADAATSRPPTAGGQGSAASGAGATSRAMSPAERGSGLVAAATPGTGADAAASRPPTAGGQGSAASGAGATSRAVSPAERGSGLVAAAAPGASGPGAAASGAGPGAGVAGEGRAQQLAGSGSGARDVPTAMRAASGAASSAAPAGSDGGSGQLSARTEAPVQSTREARTAPLQPQQPNGQARVIEERFTASALKVDSPRSICEIPLMFAGFDRKPIPKGLDSINATAASLPGETPPRHHPGNEAPRYPMQALGSRAEGRVLVRAEIRPDGQVGKLWIKQSSGAQTLDQAALDTVRAWRFSPAQRHGMAVAMWLDVPIEYKLPKE